MTEIRDIEVVVFDVLGTLVDEPGGIGAAIREALPDADQLTVDELLAMWQRHVEDEQDRIARGERAYATTEVIDAEAARAVAVRAGIADPGVIARLATAGQRLAPWEDSVAGIERLAWHFPVIGLSNAGRAALLRLNAFAGLRFHQALSSESAGAYKPAPEVYRLALDAAGCAPERTLMVAAHAWDLRGAQACGMRTAYIGRAVGDPPKDTDTFDGHFDGLEALTVALVSR
ncbi:haloacid dehalogenase type II [Glycomyces algeriensis]|uniref:Haloacid dehalogenase n=1 Tax=Glycomyces algeriensis TaxID=256037 RepID=A0A9W6LFX2_9ACTN|nr:haloacid dehalogenase type II [Glycomyces algeriensis]MDA1367242.1 haloacid dehalogenase type II [Glycomyces algeriensis]MDR7353374.1 2-haloacid dehalogenase [Glycomyces algeriensis]GLI41069.1 haloacid dehalogenase [Glycomyces algeriensis]